jgi:putative nucleotidyltransferase-like protein
MGDVDPAVRAAAASRFALVAAMGEVLDAMAGARIRTVLLKGPATVRLYHDPALRSAEDVDLLVEPSQAGTAARCWRASDSATRSRKHGRMSERLTLWRSTARARCPPASTCTEPVLV